MRRIVSLSSFLALFLLASSVSAEKLGGRFGVGADSSIGFSNQNLDRFSPPGLSLVYGFSDTFTGQVIFGTSFATGESGASGQTDSLSYTSTVLAPRALMTFVDTGPVNFEGLLGMAVIYDTRSSTRSVQEDYDAFFLSFEAGIRPEWFVNDFLSLHTQVGLSVSVLNSETTGGQIDSGVEFNFFRGADLFGNAGFTFWF